MKKPMATMGAHETRHIGRVILPANNEKTLDMKAFKIFKKPSTGGKGLSNENK